MLAIRLPPEIENRLATLAESTGRTKTFYAREAILTHLEDLEDYYLAADALEHVKQGKESIHTSEKVRSELGLDD